MMAWHFKRTEEARALAADADDAYLEAAWADPKALKKELLGTGDVAWRGAAARGGALRR